MFEPIPSLASVIQRNIEINQLTGVECRNLALSDSSGRLSVSRFIPHNLGGTAFSESDSGNIRATKLDDLEIGHVDFIKIDVEGNANKVLVGAEETIVESRPDIMIELFNHELDQAKKFLTFHGYELISVLGGLNYFFRYKDRQPD